MGRICSVMIQAFQYGDIPKGQGYSDYDLENGIQYAEDYLDAGYKHEPMDGFNLREFIAWAKRQLKDKGGVMTNEEIEQRALAVMNRVTPSSGYYVHIIQAIRDAVSSAYEEAAKVVDDWDTSCDGETAARMIRALKQTLD